MGWWENRALHTGNSYLDCLGGSIPPTSGGTVTRGSSIKGIVGGSVALGCGGCLYSGFYVQ